MLDGYKIGHVFQYPPKTELVYSNWTPRGSRVENSNHLVFFGLQYYIKHVLQDSANETFFDAPKEDVLERYKRRVGNYLGKPLPTYEHIEKLHDLGYLPIIIKGLPEGSLVPVGCPAMTIENITGELNSSRKEFSNVNFKGEDFYWVTNMLETSLSSTIWMPCTSATTAYQNRKVIDKWQEETGGNTELTPFLAHDFSMRGMSTVESAAVSGAAHLLSSWGTDTVPAIDFLETYYNANSDEEVIGLSVPACYDEQTEILTENDWVKFKDLKKDVKVAQYLENGSIEFVKPLKYYSAKYKGEMIKWYHDSPRNYVDMLVTPNHKMVRHNTDRDEISRFEAGDFSYKNRRGYSSKNKLVVSGSVGNKNKEFTAFDQLRIAFQADGSFMNRSEYYKSGQIRFSLKKKRKVNRLTEILDASGLWYTKTKHDNDHYSFYIKTNKKMTKDFSWVNLSKIDKKWCDDFVNELSHWDGAIKNNCVVFSSTNFDVIDKIQSICAISNKKTQISYYQDKRNNSKRKLISNVVIQNDKTLIVGDKIKRSKVQYEGKVYCVSVPSKMLIVRRNGKVSICGNSEHAVMCAGGHEKDSERETYRRLIEDVYPTGIVSLVSDTWDLWHVVEEILPSLKNSIMARDGKLVIRPDSSKTTPDDILCGWADGETEIERKGLVEALWDIFGGTVNEKGFKTLDSHIGAIYGDAIYRDRMDNILRRLSEKGFTSDNVVFGIGSYTYQMVTRDTYNQAVKATAVKVDGQYREIFKDPATDSGGKKSAKGFIAVHKDENDQYYAQYPVSHNESRHGEMIIVFDGSRIHTNGGLLVDQSLSEIRHRLHGD